MPLFEHLYPPKIIGTGRSVSFPSNVVGDHMLASLERDGVDSVILEGHPQRAFDLQGAYRHISVSTSDLEHGSVERFVVFEAFGHRLMFLPRTSCFGSRSSAVSCPGGSLCRNPSRHK